ncbi:MAG: outer membrane beta-barrel protein [Syntrophobacteraceae bacterium]
MSRKNKDRRLGSEQRKVTFSLFTAHCSLFTVHSSLFTVYCSLLCILSVCAVNRDAFAADWSFTPSVSLSQSYDSNFRFIETPVPGTTKGDFVTSLTPVLSVSGETEQTKFQFDTTTNAQSYIENPKFDIINENATASLTELWSQRFSTSVNFGLIHDSTLNEQLEASGIITQWAERYVYTLGLGAKYDLSESLSLAVSGLAADTIFPSGTSPNSDLYQGTITPTWAVTPKDNVGLSTNFSDTDYTTTTSAATTIKSITESLFWQRQMSDTLRFKLSGGYYFSMIDFTVPAIEFIRIPPFLKLVNLPETATDGGLVYSADITKDWTERLSTTFSAGKQQYNDVNAQSFDSTYVSGTVSYKLSERTTFNFMARYNTNDQLSPGNSTIDYYILSPSIETSLTENLLVRLSGSYEYETETPGNVNLDRYRTWVDLTYKWPRFFASH